MADRSALARATESTDSPTPGYLYIDIAKSVSVSPIACKDTITYLIRRLQSNKNHNVKFKCLKVITKTAEKCALFKREIVCNNEAMSAIKNHLNYSGVPDPVRGDEMYNRVRGAAKDCLDMVYSDSKSESMGGSGFSGPSMSMGGNERRMEGIGNPMFSDPRQDQSKGVGNMTVGEVAQTVGETFIGMIRDPLAKGVEKGMVPARFAPPGSKELSDRTGGEWNMASNRGPNAIDPNRNYNSGPNAIDPNRNYHKERDGTYYRAKDTSAFQWAQGGGSVSSSAVRGGVGGAWAQPSVASQARSAAHNDVAPMGNVGAAASDGTYEKNLIQELCPPGGLKAEPPSDKLASFAGSLSSLDPDLICPALLDCLEDGQPWMMKAKALCVMETALKASSATAQPYADFFHACLVEFEPLAAHPRQAIKDPARRVLHLLGVQSAPTQRMPSAPPPPPPQSHAPPPPEPVADLLDFGEDVSAPPIQDKPDNLFGGLEVRAEEPSAPPPVAPPVPPPPPPVEPTSTMFADLSIKDNTPTPPTAPSGFSFLNNAAPEPTPAPELTSSITSNGTTPAPAYNELLDLSIATETPKQTPKTFDPLLSNQPTSPNKMMQYQQQMMMPQYNYNPNYNIQMQMAMQQQMRIMMPSTIQGMPSPIQGQHKNIMIGAGNAARQSNISFINEESNKKKEQQLKSFDFVKDAMKSAK